MFEKLIVFLELALLVVELEVLHHVKHTAKLAKVAAATAVAS